MPKSSLNVSLKGADDIFSTEESRQEQQREQVQQIPIGELFPFKNHPFKVLDDESMQRTVESVEQYGVLSPLIARPRPEGGYEIISGHRRQHAAQLAGLETLPVIVRNMDDDAAVLLMVDSNLQRESILPSERAFAYKMKLEALKNQGARSDLTSSQVGMKLQALDIVGQEAGDSRNQVHRFIRLTSLIPELLDMVDEKKIAFNPAVELSYLDESQQRDFLEAITNRYLEAAGRPERVDLRSFERQGIQQIPTVHLGPAAHQMEKRGVETFLGNLNRDIRATNSLMQSIRSAIRGLQRWIADLNEKKQLLLDALEKAKEPTLSDLLVDYFNLRNEQRSDWSGKAKLKCTVRDFEEIRQAVDYLKAHSLNTIEDLDTAISNLNQTAAPLRKQLKQNENRMRAIAQIRDAAAVHAKLKPIHDTFMKKNFKLTKDAYAAQHKDELESFNKAVRTLMKLNGSTAVNFSALDAEFSALQSGSAELRTQLETLQPDISALKNIRKYIDMVLNKQQLSAPGGKTSEKESVLKKLEEAKAAQSQKKTEQKNHTQEL